MMADNLTWIPLSAFSGLAGALITQVIHTMNTYFSDKRKESVELSGKYRDKKVETGENFYYMAGEKMASIKKNIGYWKNWNNARTEASLEFLNKETFRFNAYMEKLDADNWKFNLVSLYFPISFTTDEVVLSNAKSHQLYLKYLDLAEKIRKADAAEKEGLYQRYALVIFDMCAHYEEIYARLENDRNLVKSELASAFGSASK